jgi:hypothetical protein
MLRSIDPIARAAAALAFLLLAGCSREPSSAPAADSGVRRVAYKQVGDESSAAPDAAEPAGDSASAPGPGSEPALRAASSDAGAAPAAHTTHDKPNVDPDKDKRPN